MEFITPILIVGIIGLLAGIILAVASIVMAVPKDEKAEALEEILPGANCGACGYSGCSGYAAAMSQGCALPAGRLWLKSARRFWARAMWKWRQKPPWCGAWEAMITQRTSWCMTA